jgi:hypothetical protein
MDQESYWKDLVEFLIREDRTAKINAAYAANKFDEEQYWFLMNTYVYGPLH